MLQFENKMLINNNIYIGAKLEYEMLSNISSFTDLKYAFIALVMLLFQPVKKCPLQYSLSHI